MVIVDGGNDGRRVHEIGSEEEFCLSDGERAREGARVSGADVGDDGLSEMVEVEAIAGLWRAVRRG